MRMHLSQPIVLIGPTRAGKSTIGGLLATELGICHRSLDSICRNYYREHLLYSICRKSSFTANDLPHVEIARTFSALAQYGGNAVGLYIENLHAYAAFRTISDVREGVLDFGSGHTCYTSKELKALIVEFLERIPNVFLVMPSEDMETSAEILLKRRLLDREFEHTEPFSSKVTITKQDILQELQVADFHAYSNNVVYTRLNHPEQTMREIVSRLVCDK
jgi:hypothetical protein